MKTVSLLGILLIIGILTIAATAASESGAKPTRETVIAFIESGMKEPLSEEEQKLALTQRKPVDIAAQFGTDFTGLDLSHIECGGYLYMATRIPVADGVNFSQCNFAGSNFNYASLNNCIFDGAVLTGARFYSCEFDNTDFSNAKLQNTEIYWSSFKNSNFSRLHLQNCKIWGCDFVEADVSETDFSGTEMYPYGTKFPSANCAGTCFRDCDLSYADFSNACLKNADFSKAKLYKANFTGANLEGADFTGANLGAAIFSSVTGIDDAQRQALEKRTARWWYDLKENIADFLTVAFYPGYLLTLIFSVICSVVGLRYEEKKTRSFLIAFFLNGFAVFSTLCTFLMMFSGGHPVRQMSGSMDVWSAWLSFFPIPAFGLMFCVGCSFVLICIVITLLIRNRNNCRPWQLFLYQVLTLVHCFLAFHWLIMFMPDA